MYVPSRRCVAYLRCVFSFASQKDRFCGANCDAIPLTSNAAVLPTIYYQAYISKKITRYALQCETVQWQYSNNLEPAVLFIAEHPHNYTKQLHETVALSEGKRRGAENVSAGTNISRTLTFDQNFPWNHNLSFDAAYTLRRDVAENLV